MAGFWGSIFGSDKAVGGLMDTADAMWETTEEKSKAKMMFLRLYEPFKKVQRIIVVTVVTPFVAIHAMVAMTWLAMIWFPSSGEMFDFRVSQLKEVANMNNLTLGDPVAWILAFYFLGGAGEGIVKAWSARVNKK